MASKQMERKAMRYSNTKSVLWEPMSKEKIPPPRFPNFLLSSIIFFICKRLGQVFCWCFIRFLLCLAIKSETWIDLSSGEVEQMSFFLFASNFPLHLECVYVLLSIFRQWMIWCSGDFCELVNWTLRRLLPCFSGT